MKTIDREESIKIKGLAMIFIVLHNFLHLISNVRENEMSFDLDRLYIFFEAIQTIPSGIPTFSISFFGAYFVQIFIVLSAYGLTKKRMASPKLDFQKQAYPPIFKIYSLFLPVFVFHGIIYLAMMPAAESFQDEFISFGLNSLFFLVGIYNFSYDTLFGSPMSILSAGPWWFCFLIIQFYLLFPVLFLVVKKLDARWWSAVLVSYILIYALLPMTELHGIPLFANAPGHLPEFLLGIALALRPSIQLKGKHACLGLIVFILSMTNKWTFPLTFLSAAIVTLYFSRLFFSKIDQWALPSNIFLVIGNASMFMFITNAQIRNITLRIFENAHPLMMLLGALLHLGLVFLVSILYGRLYNRKIKGRMDALVVRLFPN